MSAQAAICPPSAIRDVRYLGGRTVLSWSTFPGVTSSLVSFFEPDPNNFKEYKRGETPAKRTFYAVKVVTCCFLKVS